MTPRLALLFLAALLTTTPGQADDKPARTRPNVLLLVSDDQRPDTIAALGNREVRTPHLDTLVENGTAFTRATCANPLCVPSRAEILSGCTGFRNGVIDLASKFDPRLELWPQVMRKAGYHTWSVGKWHTAGRPSQRGYEECLGLFAGGPPSGKPYLDHRGRPATGYVGWQFQTDDGRRSPEKGVGLTPDISATFADAAIAFIRRKPDRPFFLHVNFTAPHDPRLLPSRYQKAYDPARLKLPANFLTRHPFDHGNQGGRDEKIVPVPLDQDEVKAERAAYYAVLSHLDEQIGRILTALRETRQEDRTFVLFTSDHGLALGSHGLMGKQNMYEHTIGVPLIFRGPGIPRGKRSAAACYLRDLYPTVCELAGIPVPTTVQGKSLAPVLRGAADRVHDAVFGYFRDRQRMIRTDRWKLIHYPQIKRYQLFDLRNDPDERKNLSGDPAHAGVVRDLQRKLITWQKENGDALAN